MWFLQKLLNKVVPALLVFFPPIFNNYKIINKHMTLNNNPNVNKIHNAPKLSGAHLLLKQRLALNVICAPFIKEQKKLANTRSNP